MHTYTHTYTHTAHTKVYGERRVRIRATQRVHPCRRTRVAYLSTRRHVRVPMWTRVTTPTGVRVSPTYVHACIRTYRHPSSHTNTMHTCMHTCMRTHTPRRRSVRYLHSTCLHAKTINASRSMHHASCIIHHASYITHNTITAPTRQNADGSAGAPVSYV
jgi:hypothetical protein